MNTFWTADLHLGHARILEYCNRPFDTVEEMDEAIISNWNNIVTSADTVWVLGDFSFHNPNTTRNMRRRLNGTINIVLGNHDKSARACLDMFGNGKQLHANKNFTNIQEITMRDDNGEKQKIVMCHYAMEVWNKSHYGSLHLHGHSHGTLPSSNSQKRLDVGVDYWNFFPVNWKQIQQAMKKKVFIPVDHHKGKTGSFTFDTTVCSGINKRF